MTFGRPDAPALALVDPVTGFTAAAGNGQVGLSWANPTTAFTQVTIVRKAGAPPADLADGTVVYDGTGTSVTDTGLTNGTQYFYAAWVQRNGDISVPARLDATPTGLVPDAVKNLQAIPSDARIDLSWANPTSTFDRVRVVRKTGAPPATPADGTVVYTVPGRATPTSG